jgi:hypothetical protein
LHWSHVTAAPTQVLPPPYFVAAVLSPDGQLSVNYSFYISLRADGTYAATIVAPNGVVQYGNLNTTVPGCTDTTTTWPSNPTIATERTVYSSTGVGHQALFVKANSPSTCHVRIDFPIGVVPHWIPSKPQEGRPEG